MLRKEFLPDAVAQLSDEAGEAMAKLGVTVGSASQVAMIFRAVLENYRFYMQFPENAVAMSMQHDKHVADLQQAVTEAVRQDQT